MLESLWKSLMSYSDVVTNMLDLISFVFATPEIIGSERIARARKRAQAAKDRSISTRTIYLITVTVVVAALSSAAYFVLHFAFTYSVWLGVLAIPLVVAFSLFVIWGAVVIIAFQQFADSLSRLLSPFFVLNVLAVEVLFSWIEVLTPRGMLYTAALIFFLSRVIAVVHALAVH
jgi:hypothetical protein